MRAQLDAWMCMYDVYILAYAIAPTERQVEDYVCYERRPCDQKCKGITCEQIVMKNNPINNYNNALREVRPHMYADMMFTVVEFIFKSDKWKIQTYQI